MKKIILSAAVAAMALSTSAFAADKGIDITTTGQGVVYFQTHDNGDESMFGQTNSSANVGLQLNLDADLKNGFTFGSQISYLGTAGLEKTLVSGTMQGVTDVPAGLGGGTTTNQLALTQINIAKTVGNTTVKLGRQELPKSLSPFAYSEGWNVFKNTFDAILAINTDIPDTTLVGAYVSGGTGGGIQTTQNLVAPGTAFAISGAAYMLTAQNKSIPMTTLTGSYYDVSKVAGANSHNANAMWLDAAIAGADMPLGLTVGIQGGQIALDLASMPAAKDTTAFGVKVGLAPVDALTVGLAFTSVDDGTVAIKNFGTGIKSPLYTQMVANQNAISLDGDTMMASAAYSFGAAGTVTARGTLTSAGTGNMNGENDFRDLELLYTVNAGGVSYLAAFVNTELDDGSDAVNIVRLWARLNF